MLKNGKRGCLPKAGKSIGCKWLFGTQYTEDGEIEEDRARSVADIRKEKGNQMMRLLLRFTAIKTVMAVAANKNFPMRMLRFLNGDLKEELYMKRPQGVKKGPEKLVCRLKKSL